MKNFSESYELNIHRELETSLDSGHGIDDVHFQDQNAFEKKLKELSESGRIKEGEDAIWRERFDIPPPQEEMPGGMSIAA